MLHGKQHDSYSIRLGPDRPVYIHTKTDPREPSHASAEYIDKKYCGKIDRV
jgi:hypothetical protein